jgi:hypothetical protein
LEQGESGISDPKSVLRFRREARAAARLHHTNIVPVFDIGERQGIHYYAMQFIQGQGLDEVIRELRGLRGRMREGETAPNGAPSGAPSLADSLLSGQYRGPDQIGRRSPKEGAGSKAKPPIERSDRAAGPSSALLSHSDFSSKSDIHFFRCVARIGQQVASALAYAHGQHVMHRDIKPSNLLLDANGTVWVTDFGLAKEEGENLTRTGDVVGTLRYIAPERFTRASDARSDIYSLGLTLYELMTLQAAFIETDRVHLVHAIGHRDPEPPRKLDPRVPRDLETIVLKAITKEPSRRYARAEDLEEDLSRFLLDRPIAARRASGWERSWRWCRRNPMVASLAAALGLILVASMASLTGLYLNADAQRRRAESAETEARQGEAKSRQSEADAKAVLEFFEKQVLAAPRPRASDTRAGRVPLPTASEGGTGRNTTIRAAVDRAEKEIAHAFQGQPLVEASIREALGNTYAFLEELPRAIQQHERALALRKKHLGADDPETLNSQGSLAQDYQYSGRLADALKLHQDSFQLRRARLGPDHPKTLITMSHLGETLRELGRLQEAISVYEDLVRRSTNARGADSPDTLEYLIRLAKANRAAGRLTEASASFEKVLELQRSKLGADDPQTIRTMLDLGSIRYNAGRVAGALSLWEEALRRAKVAQGSSADLTLNLMSSVATAYMDTGRMAEAIRLMEENLGIRRANQSSHGRNEFSTLATATNLAGAYRDAGRLDDAQALFQETLEAAQAKLGADQPLSLILMNYTAGCLLELKRPDEAAALLRDCLQRRSHKDPQDWWVFQTKSQLGQALTGLKSYSEAEALLIDAHAGLTARKEKMLPRHRRYIGEAAQGLVNLYEAWDKKDQAASWRQKLPLPRKESRMNLHNGGRSSKSTTTALPGKARQENLTSNVRSAPIARHTRDRIAGVRAHSGGV